VFVLGLFNGADGNTDDRPKATNEWLTVKNELSLWNEQVVAYFNVPLRNL
jgi:hypothetical protein